MPQKFLNFIARLFGEMAQGRPMNEGQKVANGQSLSRSQDQLRREDQRSPHWYGLQS